MDGGTDVKSPVGIIPIPVVKVCLSVFGWNDVILKFSSVQFDLFENRKAWKPQNNIAGTLNAPAKSPVACWLTYYIISRGGPRLDGARGKQQVWRLLGANILCWRKYLRYCWDFFAPPMIRRQGHCAPLPLPRYVPDLQGYLPYRFQLLIFASSIERIHF